MGMRFAPTWHRQVSPPPLLHKTTLTTAELTFRLLEPLGIFSKLQERAPKFLS